MLRTPGAECSPGLSGAHGTLGLCPTQSGPRQGRSWPPEPSALPGPVMGKGSHQLEATGADMGAVLGSGQGARPHREHHARGRTWRQGRRAARTKGISTVPLFQECLSLELSRTHTRAPKQKGSESRVGAQGLWSSPPALRGWHPSPPGGARSSDWAGGGHSQATGPPGPGTGA